MTIIIRPLKSSDLEAIYRIVNKHDEDDGEEVRADLSAGNVKNLYVAVIDGETIGVSGYRPVHGTLAAAFLSWTYLDPSHIGNGFGKALVLHVLKEARTAGAEKMYIKVSTYPGTYESALSLYLHLGFREELRNVDFYDEDEDQLILVKQIESSLSNRSEDPVKDEKPTIRFNGVYEIGDTRGAYSFSWDVYRKSFFGRRSFDSADIGIGIDAVQKAGGRIIFLTFPSNLPLIHKPLQQAGFKYVGRLKDYYEPGIDEMHFVRQL